MDEDKRSAWFGLNERFDWQKARAIGPLITVAAILIIGGLFSLAIIAAFKLLGAAVFNEVPQDGFAKFGLTGIIVAMIGAPFVVWRSVMAQKQVSLNDQALTNEKMNTAVDDLHAQRQVTKWKNKIASNGWEDDITRRNGAIDRLLGLVQENETLRPRVDRLLTVYLRELTREYPAKAVPEDTTPEQIKEWASGLTRVRSDMENAVQVLSRLPRPDWKEGDDHLPDLQKINMQAFNLSGLTLKSAHLSMAELQGANLGMAELQGANLRMAQLQGAHLSMAQLQGANLRGAELQGADLLMAQLQGANLRGSELQGADLRGAELQGANLRGAQLQGANLRGAQLQGADLRGSELQGAHLSMAQLQGANLRGAELQGADLRGAELQGTHLSMAELQGADLRGAQFDASTDFSAAMPAWAALKWVDFSDVPQIAEHLAVMFGDRSVKLPKGVKYPEHWPEAELDWHDFETQWRAWQRKGGFDPDNPA